MRVIPDGTVKITYANIILKTHDDCHKREWYYGRQEGKLGDVRRCEHGKVQIMLAPSRYSSIAGPGSWFWYTLSPLWDLKQYRRAKRALEQQ